jgi:hypothetical protein
VSGEQLAIGHFLTPFRQYFTNVRTLDDGTLQADRTAMRCPVTRVRFAA